MSYCQVCLVTIKLSVSASINLDVKTIGIGLSVKNTISLALSYIVLNITYLTLIMHMMLCCAKMAKRQKIFIY